MPRAFNFETSRKFKRHHLLEEKIFSAVMTSLTDNNDSVCVFMCECVCISLKSLGSRKTSQINGESLKMEKSPSVMR